MATDSLPKAKAPAAEINSTCVEASKEAARKGHCKYGDHVRIINDTFEQVYLPQRYDNIFMTHVLEHVICLMPLAFQNGINGYVVWPGRCKM